MRFFNDDAYVFSVLGHDLGTILACRSRNIIDHAGKNFFDLLCVDRGEISFFKESLSSYENMAFAALCGKSQKRAVLFFRNFIGAAGVCLAVVTDFNAEDVSWVLQKGGFEKVVVSETLQELSSEDCDFSYAKHEEIFKYLSQLFLDVGTMSLLKLQYGSENPETVRLCAEAAASLAGASPECESYLGESEEIFYSEDIFDGRFCAASLLLLAFVARCYGKGCYLKVEIVKGLKSFRIKATFHPQNDKWKRALDHLKSVATYNTGISFGYEESGDKVETRFIPFYADVGLVGVKEGEERFSIVDFLNYFDFQA